MTERAFPAGVVLTAMTGRMLCSVGELYDVLNFLTQDKLYTHQLVRASKECAPWLRRWFPQLAELDTSVVTPENWRAWLDEAIAKVGSSFTLRPIPRDDHDVRDPIEELVEIVGPDKVIVVKVEE